MTPKERVLAAVIMSSRTAAYPTYLTPEIISN